MRQPDEWEPSDADGFAGDDAFPDDTVGELEDLADDDDADDDADDDDADDDDADDGTLDDEFPLGDGVAAHESVVSCPYCGESVEISLDPGSGVHQEYIEDCAVCCRPWNVSVTYHDDGSADVFVDASDDQ